MRLLPEGNKSTRYASSFIFSKHWISHYSEPHSPRTQEENFDLPDNSGLFQNYPAVPALIEQLLAIGKEDGPYGIVLELLIIKSLTLERQDKLDFALAVFQRAILLAGQEEYIRIFSDKGEHMHQRLRLSATGMSNKKIGEALFITAGTVKWHTNHIYSKIKVKN